jgi:hypothetical protein
MTTQGSAQNADAESDFLDCGYHDRRFADCRMKSRVD